MKACYLCKEPAQLQRSHIVPSFVGKWLKDTSVTGFLRHGIDQSLRQQDIPKQPLLRSSCEFRFSMFEDRFARNIFYPYAQQELEDWGGTKGSTALKSLR
jgi:hypothetical protein